MLFDVLHFKSLYLKIVYTVAHNILANQNILEATKISFDFSRRKKNHINICK